MNLPTTSLADPTLLPEIFTATRIPFKTICACTVRCTGARNGADGCSRGVRMFAILRDEKRFSKVGRMSKFLNRLPENLLRELRPCEDHFQKGS
jgi:hypothetical protein